MNCCVPEHTSYGIKRRTVSSTIITDKSQELIDNGLSIANCASKDSQSPKDK